MAAQEHGFKAEVQQLLDLMIHSLYSDREIFLRELVSNAADALDKVRFLELTRGDLVAAKGEPGIRITASAETRTLTVEDDGIGLTAEEAEKNLGTIAHSGSKEFARQLAEARPGDAPRLIGQFGVGFYSSFMVAEEVVVESLSAVPGATPVRWTSKGAGTYTLEEGTRERRGTTITLHLREEAAEFADEGRLSHIVRKHSNFLAWPIRVGDKQANTGKALWAETPKNVSDEEANALYRSVAVDWRDPAFRVHVSVDSPIQYSALLFVPAERPFDLFHPEADRGPRLYARRVLILEHAREILPDWLRFVRGVVDSEDISLNVSREMVQKTPVVRKIRDGLTKRVLKDLQRLADDTEPVEVAEGEEPKPTGAERYAEIWRNFGQVLKEGYFHAPEWRDELRPLLRFNAISHADGSGQVSLAAYKAAMPEGQDAIWYLGGSSREEALQSPHLEAFKKRGWDVLLLTDAVDEWLVRELTEYEGLEIKSVARGELELDEEPGEKADITELGPWMKGVLGGEVSDVRASGRLVDSPCVLVDADDGMSANMERILRQARERVAARPRVLELNTKHPIVKNLARLHASGKTGDAEPLARLLLDDALLLEGTVRDAAGMGRRLQELLEKASQLALGPEEEPVV